MTTLRTIFGVFERWDLRSKEAKRVAAAAELAEDLALPMHAVSTILDQAAADLCTLSADDAGQAIAIVHRATAALAQLRADPDTMADPMDELQLQQCIDELPEPDRSILCYSKSGMKPADIAPLVGLDEKAVRRSLVKTYTGLRMKMRSAVQEQRPRAVAPPVRSTSSKRG